MTRSEFVEFWLATVGKGRQLNHPDITPAEAAAASVDDREMALQIWRKSRPGLGRITVEEFDQALSEASRAAAVRPRLVRMK